MRYGGAMNHSLVWAKQWIGLAAVAALLAGCGQPQEPATTASADGVRSVRIAADDQMRFSVTEIVAAPGEALRVTLNNFGRQPKTVMAHNWVLFRSMPEMEFNAVLLEAATNLPAYEPRDPAVVLVATRMLGPGQSETVEFNAPTEPGEYPFACTFPGHAEQMRGRLIVRAGGGG